MSFQKTVLTIAIVLFILLMLVISVMMTSAKKNEKFPPQIGQCPDYWQLTAQGNCLNTQNLGKNCKSPMDFSKMSKNQKFDFAKGCNITWDGITNAEDKSGNVKYQTQ